MITNIEECVYLWWWLLIIYDDREELKWKKKKKDVREAWNWNGDCLLVIVKQVTVISSDVREERDFITD